MRTLARVAFAAIFLSTPVMAEKAPKTVEPSAAPLAPEKQETVRDHVRRAKVPEATLAAPASVGMTVPENVELWGLPEDSVTEVPQVTSYKFFHTDTAIAVVDPESRTVVQLISLQKKP
jgi:hypothetical protein